MASGPREPDLRTEPPRTSAGLTRKEGTAEDGAHLTRRQARNTALTEAAQSDPTGGAHSDKPDPTNP